MAENTANTTIKINVDSKEALKSLRNIKNTFNAVISALAIKQLYSWTEALSKAGAEGIRAERTFRNFVPNVIEASNRLSKASLGMIEDTRLQQDAIQAMISGIKFDDYIIALEYATKFAISTGKRTEDVLSSITSSFITGRTMGLRQAGIVVNSGKNMMTDAMNQMKLKMKELDASVDDPIVKMQQFKIDIENLKDAIGRDLIPVFLETNKIILELLKEGAPLFTQWLKGNVALIKLLRGESLKSIEATNAISEAFKISGEKGAEYLFNYRAELIKTRDQIELMHPGKDREKQLKDYNEAINHVGKALKGMNEENAKVAKSLANPLKIATELTPEELKKISDEKLKRYNDYIDALKNILDSEQVIKDENEEKEKKRLEGIKNTQDLVNQHYQKIADDKNETDAKRLEALKKLAEYQLFLSNQTITAQEKEFEIRKKGFDDLGNLADNTFSVMSEFSNRHFRNEIDNLDKKKLGEKKYNKEREKILKEQQEQERNLARFQQGIILAKTIMNIAEGQGKATAKGFLGIPEWFFVAAQGAAEIAMIEAQKFQRGYLGEVDRSRRPDSINAVIGRNEAVIPGPQYAMHEEDIKAIVSNTANTAAGMRGLKGGTVIHQYYGLSAEQVISVQRDSERRKYTGSLI